MFPYIRIPQLQSVMMRVMKHCKSIPSVILTEISNDSDLYAHCDISVKRLVWINSEALFYDQILLILKQYKADPVLMENLYFYNSSPTSGAILMRRRHDNTVLSQLVLVVGDSLVLYDRVLRILRKLYVTEGDSLYCLIRSEMLIGIHEKGLIDVRAVDPCFGLILALERLASSSEISEEIFAGLFAEYVRPFHQTAALGDIAMVLHAPCYHFALLRLMHSELVRIVKKELMPAQDQVMTSLCHLLLLSYGGQSMIEKRLFPGNIPAPKWLNKESLPMLCQMLVKDLYRREVDASETCEAVPEGLATLYQQRIFVRDLLQTYFLHALQQGDEEACSMLLTLINDEEDHAVLEGQHMLVLSAVSIGIDLLHREVLTPALRDLLFSELLSERLKSPFCYCQFLRLLTKCQHQLTLKECSILAHAAVEEELPSSANEDPVLLGWWEALLQRLQKRIDGRKPWDFLRNHIQSLRKQAAAPEDENQDENHPASQEDVGEAKDQDQDKPIMDEGMGMEVEDKVREPIPMDEG